MKKTMNYTVYLLMAVAVEFFVLKLAHIELQLTADIIGAVFFVMLTFLLYRFAIDWNYFSNDYSKELKHLAIDEGVDAKIIYSTLLGLFVALANYQIIDGISFLRLYAYSMFGILGVWHFTNILRQLGNIAVMGVKKWQTSQTTSSS